MATQLSDLYALYQAQYRLRVVAGADKMRTTISWVYLLEDLENISFIRGGELLITTGMSLTGDPGWLMHLLTSLEGTECAGLILNTGKYIMPSDITGDILDYCEAHSLPLFTMPWEIHISDVMQDICNQIFLNSYHDNMLTQLFSGLLQPAPVPPDTLYKLEQEGFGENDTYVVLMLRGIHSTVYLESLLRRLPASYHYFMQENQIVLILHNCTYKTSENFIQRLFGPHTRLSSEKPTAGVGEIVRSLADIRYSYQNALAALQLAEQRGVPCVYYKDLGIDRLLLSVPNRSLLQDFCGEYLDPLAAYDKQHQSDLMHTLETYLESDRNIAQTAAALYTHRNTIHHRLQKISSLIPLRLDRDEDCIKLLIAFHIRSLQV